MEPAAEFKSHFLFYNKIYDKMEIPILLILLILKIPTKMSLIHSYFPFYTTIISQILQIMLASNIHSYAKVYFPSYIFIVKFGFKTNQRKSSIKKTLLYKILHQIFRHYKIFSQMLLLLMRSLANDIK